MTAGPGWHFIAQQVPMMPFDVRHDGAAEPVYSVDNWNGYRAARHRMAGLIDGRGLKNVVIGSGDMHQHVVGTLPGNPDDPLSPPIATEFLATSVTSGGSGSERQAHQRRTSDHNPLLQLLNNQRGYQLYRADGRHCIADIKVLDQVDRPDGRMGTAASYVVENGRPSADMA